MSKKLLPIATKKQRLKIYKKVLADADLSETTDTGLCIDLRDFSGRSSFDWYYSDTPIHFPEFGVYYEHHGKKQFIDLYFSNTKQWRIKVLKACIKLCEK